jgi:hypothetical protein
VADHLRLKSNHRLADDDHPTVVEQQGIRCWVVKIVPVGHDPRVRGVGRDRQQ